MVVINSKSSLPPSTIAQLIKHKNLKQNVALIFHGTFFQHQTFLTTNQLFFFINTTFAYRVIVMCHFGAHKFQQINSFRISVDVGERENHDSA
jgi:hypothetical protein